MEPVLYARSGDKVDGYHYLEIGVLPQCTCYLLFKLCCFNEQASEEEKAEFGVSTSLPPLPLSRPVIRCRLGNHGMVLLRLDDPVEREPHDRVRHAALR